MEDITKILLTVGGTICAALIAALKILWSKLEFLTKAVLDATAKLNKLEGRHEYIENLHNEILEIVEKKDNQSQNLR